MTDEEFEVAVTELMLTHDVSINRAVTIHRVIELCHERADTVRDLWRLLCGLYVAKDWSLPVEYANAVIEERYHKRTPHDVLRFVMEHAVAKKRGW